MALLRASLSISYIALPGQGNLRKKRRLSNQVQCSIFCK
jgi:hypothetical protein